MATPEARIEQTEEGAVVASKGWFVLNVGDVAWQRQDIGGEWMNFEPRDGRFEQYGIGIHVLQPGPHLRRGGDGPCAILMVGARGNNTLHYPTNEVAAQYGAAAPEETNTPSEAYKDWPEGFRPVRATWPV